MASSDAITEYQRLDKTLESQGHVELVNDNFDTGTITRPGEYPLADKTYADLVDRLAKDHFAQVSPELRADILAFFSDKNAPLAVKKNKKQWERIAREVDDLKATSVAESAPWRGKPAKSSL